MSGRRKSYGEEGEIAIFGAVVARFPILLAREILCMMMGRME
jgi:hypothetical protein